MTDIKPLTDVELKDALLTRVKNDPGAIIAAIIRPFRQMGMGEQTLRTRLFKMEKEGLIRIERRFGRAYVFPVEGQ